MSSNEPAWWHQPIVISANDITYLKYKSKYTIKERKVAIKMSKLQILTTKFENLKWMKMKLFQIFILDCMTYLRRH